MAGFGGAMRATASLGITPWGGKGKACGKGKQFEAAFGKGKPFGKQCGKAKMGFAPEWSAPQVKAPAEEEWDPDDLISPAIHHALAPVAHLEDVQEQNKIEKKLRQYAKNAKKGLEFGQKSLEGVINDYCDTFFSSIFQSLGAPPWLNDVDLLMVVDAGIKETFPPEELEAVTQTEFEQTVLRCHDRSYEEQRFQPILWDVVKKNCFEKATQKKANVALVEGRQAAAMNSPAVAEDFVNWWVHGTVQSLAVIARGDPAYALSAEKLAQIFHALIKAGCLPLPLTAKAGLPPDDWWWVEAVVGDAYQGKPMRKVEAWEQAQKTTGTWGDGGWNGGGGNAAAQQWGNESGEAGWANVVGAWGADGNAPSAKRLRSNADPQVQKGHPQCTQAEDCVGNTASGLVQHLDGNVRGDIYCKDCWDAFSGADPSLRCAPCY